ncbi:ABC transporter ATP-binding protein [Candidatus Synechococcus calcipolaris G9]|uniref:ABC transporter ATP-binding protein n=1 Tax=Candidatus Synechococcus calcipolaris G9 TaxID=1497997 RepID=A0ABT6EZP2_9SYNE|nr:ABC transporter ATP-binding protein [Candidatus Synechococcus calcipolaris]MDG2991075.1 ABC transporter ATP-binding protein [Candidatus Synechococcus calcipolaris G9]
MIDVEHLTKTYGSTLALRDVSFRAETGEILGLLGPNGAGKTTTMRILSGYLPATSGTAAIAGYDVHENPMAVRQRIGYLPENPPLYTEMTVESYLHFVGRIKGISSGDRPQQVNRALKSCGLEDRRKTIIRKLSKGYRQRVGIAQAIVHDPPAIILDEPTVGLDPRQIIEVRKLIQALAGQRTIILSTHILPEVSMTCDRAVIINRGEVVGVGKIDDLMHQLSGGYAYNLEVAGDPEQIQNTLGGISAIQTIEWYHNEELARHERYQLLITCQNDLGADIATALVHANLGLYEMRRSQANLEDVFLKLTTDDSASPLHPAMEGDAVDEHLEDDPDDQPLALEPPLNEDTHE